MLKIGEFAKITGISIHMLRNYDKNGLLIPEKIDSLSGYRYYSERQIMIANQIQLLKSLGFGLQEISLIQWKENDNEQLKSFLRDKINEKEQERDRIEEQIRQMKAAIGELDENQPYAMKVTIKKVPERKVAIVRKLIHTFPEEGQLWTILNEEGRRNGIHFADVNYAYEIVHGIHRDTGEIDVEVQLVVDQIGEDTESIQFHELPACEVAAIAFQGDYDQITTIYPYIKNWVKKNGYEMNGKSFSTYYRSPGNEKDVKNFITELCFPIIKKTS